MGMEIKVKFHPGLVVVTPAAKEHLGSVDDAMQMIRSHISGAWGELCEEDKAANDLAVAFGNRILSCYHAPDGEKVWVITEWDRSVTTILLPSDY